MVRGPDMGITGMLQLAETQATTRAPFAPSALVPFYELESAVLRILETPNALARYLEGEDIFEGCARHSDEAALRKARDLLQLAIPGA